jgi:drug/metabolite transporter (DMT)-like permease
LIKKNKKKSVVFKTKQKNVASSHHLSKTQMVGFCNIGQLFNKSGPIRTNCPVFSTGLQMLLAGAIACSVSAILNPGGRILLNQSISFSTVLKTQILPLGIARAIDIGCGNAALSLVTVALQQILKSLLPLFVCILSYFVLGNHVSQSVWVSLIPIVFGSLLAAWPSSSNDSSSSSTSSSSSAAVPILGIALALISTFGRSMKAVLNSKLVTGSKQALPLAPLEVLSLEAPTSGIILLSGSILASIIVFRASSADDGTDGIESIGICGSSDSFSFIRVNVFAGILMFFNQLSYITVIKLSSALSCQVLMNLKMLLLIFVSILIFATPLSGLNVLGMLFAFVGCLYYAVASAEDEKKKIKIEKETMHDNSYYSNTTVGEEMLKDGDDKNDGQFISSTPRTIKASEINYV